LLTRSFALAADASCTVGFMAVDDVVVVVGAGVVGLTTAISLAEAGVATEVVAAEPPSRVTSAAAGAIWGPVTCGPDDRCYEWSRTGLEVLSALADETSTGVHPLHGRVVSAAAATPPKWTDLLSDLQILGVGELPTGLASGWSYTAPAINMPVYLEYLLNRYAGLGGRIDYAAVASLASVDAPVVVNCTGIGARSLVGDDALVPIRGQVVVAENPGIEEFHIDHGAAGDADYVYAFPHGDVIVLGGTAYRGAFDLPPRPEVSARIMRDCAAVFPALRGARVITERVGLRPYRPQVRLEAETLPGGRALWHNYGHGGAGVTLSWGCAREITSAVIAGATSA
jgi:D-amino-acid oxidase